MTAEHSAVPWNTDGLVVWRGESGPAICTARNLEPKEGTLAPIESVEEQRANLEFIARACNTHGDLVNMLTGLFEWIENNVAYGLPAPRARRVDELLKRATTVQPLRKLPGQSVT